MDIKLHKLHQYVQESHFWFRVKDNFLKDVALKYFKPGGAVLDFGCNYGHAVRLLQTIGFDASGVDISEEAIRHGKRMGIRQIFLDSEKNFLPNSFDAIISLDVMEHIKDDTSALVYVHNLVKENGIVVLMVPALNIMWGLQDIISHHHRRYTLGQLVKLSERSGNFEVLRKSYSNTFLFLPILAVRLFTRYFVKHPRESDLNLNSPIMNKILFWIFDSERKLLRYVSMPIGVSAFVVLRKK